MSVRDVQNAVCAEAAAILGGIPVERENTPISHPPGSKWAQIFFHTGEIVGRTLGEKGSDFMDTELEVAVYYPLGSGDAAAADDLEAFRSRAKAGAGAQSNRQGATFRPAYEAHRALDPPGPTPRWWRVLFRLPFYALVPR